jgi:hypothetical protein
MGAGVTSRGVGIRWCEHGLRLLTAAFSLAFASACMPEPRNAAHGEIVLASAANEPKQDDIIGKYVVTYVDGAAPIINIEGHEPTITITRERIHFQSQCIYADWTYERDGETISTTPYYLSAAKRDQSRPSCHRADAMELWRTAGLTSREQSRVRSTRTQGAPRRARHDVARNQRLSPHEPNSRNVAPPNSFWTVVGSTS